MPEPDLFELTRASPARPLIREDYRALREDGQFACLICGAAAAFGSGVSLRRGELGFWLCFKHWREGIG
jgi:hypothetical protein